MYDYSGLFAIWSILTVGLVCSFLPAIRKFHALQGLIAIMWLVFTALIAICFQDPVIVQVFYPWILPLIYLFPALIEWHTNQTIGVPIFTRKDFVFFVMPVVSAMSTIVMVFAKSSPYQDNIALIMDFKLLDLEQGLNSFFSAILFLSFFSLTHAVVTLLKLKNMKTSGANWVYLTLPIVEGIMATGIIVHVGLNFINENSGTLTQMVCVAGSIILSGYVLGLKGFEKERSQNEFFIHHLIFSTKNLKIKEFLKHVEPASHLLIMADFTKENLSLVSEIEENEWDAYLIEIHMSWPVFKSHVRIQYALKVIKEGYLINYTLTSLIADLGYESRSSFYRAFELVTKKPFDLPRFKKN